jgi:hypothetical protein
MLHPSAGQFVQEPLDLALQLGDGALARQELVLCVADRLAELHGPLLELFHREPRRAGAVPTVVYGQLLLPTGRHERLALALKGVEPGSGLPESLDVPRRPDHRGGLLHRVAQVPISPDQAHEHSSLGALLSLGRGQLLSRPADEVLHHPLHFPRHWHVPRLGYR